MLHFSSSVKHRPFLPCVHALCVGLVLIIGALGCDWSVGLLSRRVADATLSPSHTQTHSGGSSRTRSRLGFRLSFLFLPPPHLKADPFNTPLNPHTMDLENCATTPSLFTYPDVRSEKKIFTKINTSEL